VSRALRCSAPSLWRCLALFTPPMSKEAGCSGHFAPELESLSSTFATLTLRCCTRSPAPRPMASCSRRAGLGQMVRGVRCAKQGPFKPRDRHRWVEIGQGTFASAACVKRS